MKNLEGPDASIEISLKEYGLAWELKEAETRFYFGVHYSKMGFAYFDWADLENNLDVHNEYNWVNFNSIARFAGMSLEKWDKMSLVHKIWDLVVYHGIENVFGSTYAKPMAYEEVIL
jgi:hypothetical protein